MTLQNPGSPQKTTLKTKPTNLRSPHTSHINTHPKPITHPSSTHIRSSSLNPHQHTSEALLSTHISTHPKLFSQVTHQHTSEALLSSHISVHPKLFSQVTQNSHQNSGYQSISQSVNQSGQPSFSIIIIQNTPKINLNITQKHHTLSKTASIPNPLTTPPPKKLTPSTSSAAPMPHHLPTHHKKTQPLQPPRWQTVRSSLPPFLSPTQKKSPQAQTPRNSPKTKQHHLPLRNFLSSLSNRSARAFSLNVFAHSSLRPCSIP